MSDVVLRRGALRVCRVFLAWLLPLPLCAALAQAADPITLGAVLSLTGPGAGLGQAERNGI